MAIQQIKVRARITIGNSLIVETPYVLSFNVNKVRGQISTFDASLKVLGDNINRTITGDHIKIYAGTSDSYLSNIIFSGIVKNIKISPCWDDPNYIYLNVSGEDILSVLKGKKYTRRSTASTAVWYSIDGVIRKGLRSGKFKAKANLIDTLPADTTREGLTESTDLPENKIAPPKAGMGPAPIDSAASISSDGV